MNTLALALSTALFFPSLLGIYTGTMGIDGVHLIEHRQTLTLVSPWTPREGCREAHLALTFTTSDGRVVKEVSEIIPPCHRLVVQNPEERWGLNLDGLLLRVRSDVPVAGTWRLEPSYEWPVPAVLEEPAQGIEGAWYRFLFPDVEYSATLKDNGPSPPFVPTHSAGYLKIINPHDTLSEIAVVGYDHYHGERFVRRETVASGAERLIDLRSEAREFFGQVVVQVMSGPPVLVWGWHFQEPRSYGEATLIIRHLFPIRVE